MKSSFLKSVFVLSALAPWPSFAHDDTESSGPSDVIDLNKDNFESIVYKENPILVEFFAPWCGHCKSLAPEYEKAATALKDKGVKLAKVDCTVEEALCKDHEVQGFPTVKVFRHKEAKDYPGPRKSEDIVSYMIKQTLPAVSQVTAKNHEEFKKLDKVVLVAYLASSTEEPAPEFSAVAEKLRDSHAFGIVTDEEVIKAAGVTPPALVLYKAFDEGRNDYKEKSWVHIEAFINENATPLIDQISGENYPRYAESKLPLAYLFVDPADETHTAVLDSLKPIATEVKGKINFVWIDATKYTSHAKSLNLEDTKWPAFVIQELSGAGSKFPIDQATKLDADVIAKWVKEYSAGKLEPKLKSQTIPEPVHDGNVYILVGKQFDEVIYDDSKDVFVEFYAPWCGHCKRLAPIWQELGDRYAHNQDVLTIAKMDSVDNDLPPSAGFSIDSFPTIKFKRAGTREFIDYDGDRSLESLIQFVEQKAANKLAPAPEPTPEAPTAADSTPESPSAADPSAAHDEL